MHDLFYLIVKQGKLRSGTCEFFEGYFSETPDAATQSNNQQN